MRSTARGASSMCMVKECRVGKQGAKAPGGIQWGSWKGVMAGGTRWGGNMGMSQPGDAGLGSTVGDTRGSQKEERGRVHAWVVKAVRCRLTHRAQALRGPARGRCGADGAGELGGSGRPGPSTLCPRPAGPASWPGGRERPGPCWGRCCRRLGGGRPAPCWQPGPGLSLGSSSGAGACGRPPPRVPLGAAPRSGVRGATAMAGAARPPAFPPPGRRNLPPPPRAAPPAPAPAEPFPAPAEPGRAEGLPRRETRAEARAAPPPRPPAPPAPRCPAQLRGSLPDSAGVSLGAGLFLVMMFVTCRYRGRGRLR